MDFRRAWLMVVVVLLGVLIFAVPAQAEKQQPPRMLMLDLVPHGVPKEVAESLTDLLDLEIERAGLYILISQQDLMAMLKTEEQKQLLGVSDPPLEFLSRLGKAANAPYLLRGSVGKVGSMYTIALDIIDVKEVKAVRRVNQTLVGDESGLVGSIRTAALALALDEKGVAPDISAKLIDDLMIAEKPKKFFLGVSVGYSLPLGSQENDQSVQYFIPSYTHLRIDAELPVLPYMRVFFDTGFYIGIQQFMSLQSKREMLYDKNDQGKYGSAEVVSETWLTYYTPIKVPIHVGVKFVPNRGRLLPYGLIGAGFSWQRYGFNNEQVGITRRYSDAGQVCPAYYTRSEVSGSQLPTKCDMQATLKPESSLSAFGFDAVAGVGLEWLITQNIGLKLDVRYTFTLLFPSEDSLWADFVSDTITDPNDPAKNVTYKDMFPVKKYQQDLAASLGVIFYW